MIPAGEESERVAGAFVQPETPAETWADANNHAQVDAESHWTLYRRYRHHWPKYIFLVMIAAGEIALVFWVRKAWVEPAYARVADNSPRTAPPLSSQRLCCRFCPAMKASLLVMFLFTLVPTFTWAHPDPGQRLLRTTASTSPSLPAEADGTIVVFVTWGDIDNSPADDVYIQRTAMWSRAKPKNLLFSR